MGILHDDISSSSASCATYNVCFSQRVVEKKRIPSESVNDTIGNGIQREMGAVLFLRVFQMHACVVSASSSKPGQQ
jgi:hypothetical protein